MDQKTFLDLAAGKGNAQKLFMQGKIKIKVLSISGSCCLELVLTLTRET